MNRILLGLGIVGQLVMVLIYTRQAIQTKLIWVRVQSIGVSLFFAALAILLVAVSLN